MANRAIITPELCHQLLEYCPETGRFWWKWRDESFFNLPHIHRAWNKRRAGTEAFTSLNGKGYKSGAILSINVDAHLVAWIMYHGKKPIGEIDHINGDKSDCRIENLREVTLQENLKNKSRYRNNKIGVVGIYPECGKWSSRIGVAGKLVRLGNFYCFGQAVMTRKNAERRYGFHANHGRPK